ncbi:mitogen-activated protein kinase kinase kinase 7-like isoform X1 [Leptotrombidium deliense]|uniref:Mitogen-activated protein kinase kinase kinase 7-like isoform X1 n=1 Tax=Leptotrombidium deliense TaxID=299467 RepID=A0A443SFI7_9ACAR|nr:mitogen-activated protein kinase kinase kinase 7-like isoform X1 [Leptotrombidium deliense]
MASAIVAPLTTEVDLSELTLQEVVGRGSFGIVRKAIWKGLEVAVKLIITEQEKQSFLTEVKQLSRLNHEHIVKLHGASTKHPVCLVMEFAEGGSLHDALHMSPEFEYSLIHAINWCLQCASGVAYLHSIKPKPIVHRDLKTPNLLLFNHGTVVKICDLGTATDITTNMTSNRGTVAWMAPEVFQSQSYTESCDVYSWGVILWQVLSRQIPYENKTSYQIMWAVHVGERPPPIKNCPKPFDSLISRCWSQLPEERPSIAEVEKCMRLILDVFTEEEKSPKPLRRIRNDTLTSQQSVDYSSYLTDLSGYPTNIPQLISTEPPPLLNMQTNSMIYHRTHPENSLPVMNNFENLSFYSREQIVQNMNSQKGHKRTGSEGASSLCVPPITMTKTKSFNDMQSTTNKNEQFVFKEYEDIDEDDELLSHRSYANTCMLFDQQLRPKTPDENDEESKKLFREHKELCDSYLRRHVEVQLLLERKKELESLVQKRKTESSVDTNVSLFEDYEKLHVEKENLLQFKNNLKLQLAKIRKKSDWVFVDKVSLK